MVADDKNIEVGFEDTEDASLPEDVLSDINFSEITGSNFKKSFKNAKVKVRVVKKAKKIPMRSEFDQDIPVRDRAFIEKNKNSRAISRVIVARDRKVIVERVDKFILSDDYPDIKRINFHDGKKLKEVVLSFNNNDSEVDFDLQIFNPSMPLDFLHSASQNLNDKIKIADGTAVSYSDVLYNILANPLLVYNAKVIIAGSNSSGQINEPFRFINKSSGGEERVKPIPVGLQIDNFQKLNDCINFFDFRGKLGRPFIADGMDVIEYTVLAGMTVTIVFFCRQKLIKDLMYQEETKGNKKLL